MRLVFEKIPMFAIIPAIVWDIDDDHITIGILLGIFIIAIEYQR